MLPYDEILLVYEIYNFHGYLIPIFFLGLPIDHQNN